MTDEPQITRPEADAMALRFLRDNGPHTMGPIESEEAMAAALIFIDLKREGLATSAKMAHGYVQWSITDAGRRAVA
jgi:hypothetical protein